MASSFDYKADKVHVPPTSNTPEIILNQQTGRIELRGKSIPEDTIQFYYPFNRWLSEYAANPAPRTTVVMGLQYLNSSSTVIVTNMMRLLDNMIGLKSTVAIEWYYEQGDEEMKELGNDFKKIMKCEFKLKEVKEL